MPNARKRQVVEVIYVTASQTFSGKPAGYITVTEGEDDERRPTKPTKPPSVPQPVSTPAALPTPSENTIPPPNSAESPTSESSTSEPEAPPVSSSSSTPSIASTISKNRNAEVSRPSSPPNSPTTTSITSDPQTPAPSSPDGISSKYFKTVVIGASIGAILGTLFLVLLAFFLYRRHRSQQKSSPQPEPGSGWVASEKSEAMLGSGCGSERQEDLAELEDTGRRELEDTGKYELEGTKMVSEMGGG
ncbi:hypothetical protein BJ508DRAFT_359776 [Ascobolus immersus RN42]|uniref:Mid2 domain-containing protein n=1 Tax=Ascobolus immersus RN42 TaxID=1160509 RepID=A0A3N4IJR5_ASCIM|nr:hypothetical protein BJ508DRAFT_359776 [Ascobolus immersus RN42]